MSLIAIETTCSKFGSIIKYKGYSNIYNFILFLIWPFLAFLIACLNFSHSTSKIIILGFFLLYGLTFYLNPAMDGQRRADNLKEFYNVPFEKRLVSIENLYKETLDFVEPLLMYIVSRITDFHGALFALFALIFGSLMIYYLNNMYVHLSLNKNLNALLFFALLVVINPISEINGFRMWTAAWVYAVGTMIFIKENRKLGVFFAAFSIFIHFSFIPLVVFLLIYFFLGNRTLLYGILAILTFFVAELDIQQVRSYASLLGAASENKISAYTNEEYIEKISELQGQSVWFVSLKNLGIKYLTIVSLILIFFKTKGNFKNSLTECFYSFSLLVLSFANLSSLLPSGGRFMIVFYIFGFSAILLYYVYEHSSNTIHKLNLLGLPVIFMFILFSFRLFSDSASVYLFGSSLSIFLAFTDNISLQSILF